MKNRTASDPFNCDLATDAPMEVLLDAIFPLVSTLDQDILNLYATESYPTLYEQLAVKLIRQHLQRPITLMERPVFRWHPKGSPLPKHTNLSTQNYQDFLNTLQQW